MIVGVDVGIKVGVTVGSNVGVDVGSNDGVNVGSDDGVDVGINVGVAVGFSVGCTDGLHGIPESPVIISVPEPYKESTLYTPIRTYPDAGYRVIDPASLAT